MKPITDLLRETEGGDLVAEMTEKYYEIVEAAAATRKKGTLTIKIEFTPTGRAGMEVKADFDAKVPQHDRPSTSFFMLQDNTLSRKDPNQPDLPLRSADYGDEVGDLRKA